MNRIELIKETRAHSTAKSSHCAKPGLGEGKRRQGSLWDGGEKNRGWAGREESQPRELPGLSDELLGRGEVTGDRPRIPHLGLGWERE